MRTTVDVDDDVLLAAKDLARSEHRTLGAVLSELARRGLTDPAPVETAESFFGFAPLPRRGGIVSNDLIDQLRAEDDE